MNPFFRIFGRNKLTVLMFHKVPVLHDGLFPDEPDLAHFTHLLQFIQSNFSLISLQEALIGLKKGKLPPAAACLTLDDGYSDWFEGVVPLLRREKVPATFFITTSQLLGEPVWYERVSHAVRHSVKTEVDLRAVGLDRCSIAGENDKGALIRMLSEHCKYRTLAARSDMLMALEEAFGKPDHPAPCMSPDELRELANAGFEIGAHTVNHPILRFCNPQEAEFEIGAARETLEQMAGTRVTSFAYPNGKIGQDILPEHIAMVRKCGYASALTTEPGVASHTDHLFQIPRFTPWGKTPTRIAAQLGRNFFTPTRRLDEPTAITPEQTRDVLMVAFHYPPQCVSSGVQRSVNFVRYLPEHGWNPLVLTAHERAHEVLRHDFSPSQINNENVVRAFALDAARHLSIGRRYPRVFALPDRWSSWRLDGVREGKRLLRERHISAIWSTQPIPTAHWIAYELAKYSGLPWIADFRDPIINRVPPKNWMLRRALEAIETRTINLASKCVFTTETMAAMYRERYPQAAGKFLVIPNGYDETIFEGGTPQRHGVTNDKTLILHSGHIYPAERDPSALFSALRTLIDRGELDPAHLCVRFRASGSDAMLAEIAARHGLADILDLAEPLPYQDAINEVLGADILLLLQGKTFNAQVPAKTYEYLRAGKQILALIDHAGDTAAFLKGYSTPAAVDINDVEAITQCLSTLKHELNTPAKTAALLSDQKSVFTYSRKYQTITLAEQLTAVSGC